MYSFYLMTYEAYSKIQIRKIIIVTETFKTGTNPGALWEATVIRKIIIVTETFKTGINPGALWEATVGHLLSLQLSSVA